MKLIGKTTDDHLYNVACNRYNNMLHRQMDCDVSVTITDANLCYNSVFNKEAPARPYMHMTGTCHGFTVLDEESPYNIREVSFDDKRGISLDMYYEFSDEELSEMVLKGLFRKGFTCPDIIKHNTLSLPLVCDFHILEPTQEDDMNIPIVFADVCSRHSIQLTRDNCGYSFGDYFEEPSLEKENIFDDAFSMKQEPVQHSFDDMFEHQIEEEVVEEVVEETEFEREVREHYERMEARVREQRERMRQGHVVEARRLDGVKPLVSAVARKPLPEINNGRISISTPEPPIAAKILEQEALYDYMESVEQDRRIEAERIANLDDSRARESYQFDGLDVGVQEYLTEHANGEKERLDKAIDDAIKDGVLVVDEMSKEQEDVSEALVDNVETTFEDGLEVDTPDEIVVEETTKTSERKSNRALMPELAARMVLMQAESETDDDYAF